MFASLLHQSELHQLTSYFLHQHTPTHTLTHTSTQRASTRDTYCTGHMTLEELGTHVACLFALPPRLEWTGWLGDRMKETQKVLTGKWLQTTGRGWWCTRHHLTLWYPAVSTKTRPWRSAHSGQTTSVKKINWNRQKNSWWLFKRCRSWNKRKVYFFPLVLFTVFIEVGWSAVGVFSMDGDTLGAWRAVRNCIFVLLTRNLTKDVCLFTNWTRCTPSNRPRWQGSTWLCRLMLGVLFNWMLHVLDFGPQMRVLM